MTRLRHLRRFGAAGSAFALTRRRGRLRLPMVATLITAALVAWPPRFEVLGQSAVGRVTGIVKLTLANTAPSSASAYDRRVGRTAAEAAVRDARTW